jgi:hypothetical protein
VNAAIIQPNLPAVAFHDTFVAACFCAVACCLHPQVPAGVSLDQIRGIFAPYGEIADLNVMPPKKDGAMGEAAVGMAGSSKAAVQGPGISVNLGWGQVEKEWQQLAAK